jgi:hypothetical protein
VGVGTYSGFYETGSNSFYVNNQSRSNLAGDRALSLLYGTFAAAATDQQLTVNAGTLYVDGGTTGGRIALREANTNGENVTGFIAPASLAADVIWTLPTADGTNGQALVTNGSGTLSFASVSSGLTIGTTAITGGTSGRLLTSGTTVGELTLGTGVSTFLGTPTLANFNTALSDADVATLTGTETLSGKTLTAPRFADLGFIADANGNELLILDTVTSAVNELTLANAAAGSNPTITATGGDTNIGETHVMKGTGSFTVRAGTTSGNSQRWLNSSGTEVATLRHDGWFVTTFGIGIGNIYTTAGGLAGSTGTFGGGTGLNLNAFSVIGPFGLTGAQSLSGAGAVNVTASVTKYTSTGAAQALTLADGTDGQIKVIVHAVDGGSGVLTPTTKTGYTSLTFTNAGDTATLLYNTTIGWTILAVNGTTITP